MIASHETARDELRFGSIDARTARTPQRPSFRFSDIWKAPAHDLPIRDEILYQYLPLSPDMKVLEVGPGTGFTAFRLARRVRHITSVGVAAENVAQLREANKHVRNLSFTCADVCAPGLAEIVGAQFDAVVGLEVFEYLSQPGACLRNLASALRPGGSLLLEFPNYPPPKSPGITNFRRKEELVQLLKAAGFQTWDFYALRLRPYARLLYREFHERPIQILRRFRNGQAQALTYENTWAFRHRSRLEGHKYILHCAWAVLIAAMRLGGNCFERVPLGNEILNHDLLVTARR